MCLTTGVLGGSRESPAQPDEVLSSPIHCCFTMDLLKKELERKKKSLADAKAVSGNKRYLKAGDIRRFEEERQEKKAKKVHVESTVPPPEAPVAVRRSDEKVQSNEELSDMSLEEVTRQLREMGLPIWLFGERVKGGRGHRLAQALRNRQEELDSISREKEYRQAKLPNSFLDKDDGKPGKPIEKKSEVEDDEADDPADIHKRIYRFFKNLLGEWEDELSKRPDEERRSVAGRNEVNTMRQCKDYIKPLFKRLKKRDLEEGLTKNLLRMVEYCEAGEFVKAHDTYMDVAIGRSPWPIGVTQVGIHSRTGRSKIESQNVAHVMNSELQRKYLTSVKRLLTFVQKKSDASHSRKVL